MKETTSYVWTPYRESVENDLALAQDPETNGLLLGGLFLAYFYQDGFGKKGGCLSRRMMAPPFLAVVSNPNLPLDLLRRALHACWSRRREGARVLWVDRGEFGNRDEVLASLRQNPAWDLYALENPLGYTYYRSRLQTQEDHEEKEELRETWFDNEYLRLREVREGR